MRKGYERDRAISYIRAFAMLCIIACHFFQYFEMELAWWLNVGVEIFFVVSGFLYGGREIGDAVDFLKKQFRKILVPYYCFILPASALYVLFAPEHFSSELFVRSLFLGGNLNGIRHLWFVGYILFCYLMTPLLQQLRNRVLKKSLGKAVLLILLGILLYAVHTSMIGLFYAPERVCCYIIGYFLGALYSVRGVRVLRAAAWGFIPVGLATNALKVWWKYVSPAAEGSLPAHLLKEYGGFVHLLLGVSLFLALYLLLRRAPRCRAVALSDRYSYSVYLVHQLFILSPLAVMGHTGSVLLDCAAALGLIAVFGFVLHHAASAVDKLCLKYFGRNS